MTLRYFDKMSPYDPALLHVMNAELNRRQAFALARTRVLAALRRRLVKVPPVGALDVLCPPRSEISLSQSNRAVPFRAPWGWVWVREWDRAVARLMPWWLAAPVMLWNYRYWLVFNPLLRLGVIHVAEGDLYTSARSAGWCARAIAFVKREWPGGWDAWRESH